MLQMNIRNVSDETKIRFDVLNAQEQHKTQADTLKFLLDYYEKDDRNGTNN
jgi:plasmid stability protein